MVLCVTLGEDRIGDGDLRLPLSLDPLGERSTLEKRSIMYPIMLTRGSGVC